MFFFCVHLTVLLATGISVYLVFYFCGDDELIFDKRVSFADAYTLGANLPKCFTDECWPSEFFYRVWNRPPRSQRVAHFQYKFCVVLRITIYSSQELFSLEVLAKFQNEYRNIGYQFFCRLQITDSLCARNSEQQECMIVAARLYKRDVNCNKNK